MSLRARYTSGEGGCTTMHDRMTGYFDAAPVLAVGHWKEGSYRRAGDKVETLTVKSACRLFLEIGVVDLGQRWIGFPRSSPLLPKSRCDGIKWHTI